MTWWRAEAVAGFAAEAGFTGDELVTATAVALAASGGRDDAWLKFFFARPFECRGLWLVPVDEVNAEFGDDLYDPDVNAARARYLWETSDPPWGWSRVWGAGTWRAWRDRAAAAAAKPQRGQLPSPLGDLPDLGAMAAGLRSDMTHHLDRR